LSAVLPAGFGEVRPHLRAAHLGGVEPQIHDRLARAIVAGRVSAAGDVRDTIVQVRGDAAELAKAADAPRSESYPIVKRMLDGSATRHHVFEHTLSPLWEATKRLSLDWSNGKVDSTAIPGRAERIARIAGEILVSSPAMRALDEIRRTGPWTGDDLCGRSDAAAAELSSRLKLHAFLTRLEIDAKALSLSDHEGPEGRQLLASRAEAIAYSFVKADLPKYDALKEINSAVSRIPVGLAMKTMTVDEARHAYVAVGDMTGRALREGPPQEAFVRASQPVAGLPTKGPRIAEAPVAARGRDAGR
jgi:hypothetical protein